MSTPTRTIFIVSFDETVTAADQSIDFYDQLQPDFQLTYIKSAEETIQALEQHKPHAVIIPEPTIILGYESGETHSVTQALINYTWVGGITIFVPCRYPQDKRLPIFAFFDKGWDLRCSGGYVEEQVYRRSLDVKVDVGDKLPKQYCIPAVSVRPIDSTSLIYRTRPVTWWDVTVDEWVISRDEGPVLLDKYGEGILGWIGDAMQRNMTKALVKAMCDCRN